MSSAFVKDEDPQWLHEIPGTMKALVDYLTRENNDIRVYVKKNLTLKDSREAFEMSNGLIYSKDKDSKWEVVG